MNTGCHNAHNAPALSQNREDILEVSDLINDITDFILQYFKNIVSENSMFSFFFFLGWDNRILDGNVLVL